MKRSRNVSGMLRLLEWATACRAGYASVYEASPIIRAWPAGAPCRPAWPGSRAGKCVRKDNPNMPSLYHQLLEEVLEGDLRPREILVESALGKRFDGSRTPIREALRMLEQDGVLERVNRGMRVRQTSS